MKTSKILALMLACLMIISVAACGDKGSGDASTTSENANADGNSSNSSGANSAENANDGNGSSGNSTVSARDTLTIAVMSDGGSLDPNGRNSLADLHTAICMISEPLWYFLDDGSMLYVLATDAEINPTQWIIHLREGVKFNNGNPFTAADVMFTLDKDTNTPGLPPTFPSLDLDGSKIIDDYTIELNFFYYDLSVSTNFPTIRMYDAESYDAADIALNPIGTGPYVVSEYIVGSHLYLKRNESYWGEPAKIENLQFKILSEATQRINALQTSEVNIAEVPTQDIDYVMTLPDYTVDLRATPYTTAVWFNVSELSPLSNPEARYAICHAVDSKSVVNLAYHGYATLTDWPYSKFASDYEPRMANMHETYSVGFDLERAKQYAESSGLMDEELVIITNGAADYIIIAEIIQQNLREIGVTAVINNYDAASFFEVNADPTMYDMYISGLGAPTRTAAQTYYGWITWSPNYSENEWQGKERFVELIQDVMSIYDDSERAEVIYELTQIFEPAALWYAICEPQTARAYSADLGGIVIRDDGLPLYNYAYWTA